MNMHTAALSATWDRLFLIKILLHTSCVIFCAHLGSEQVKALCVSVQLDSWRTLPLCKRLTTVTCKFPYIKQHSRFWQVF